MKTYEKLYKSVSCTADYRFNTYRRLLSLEGASNFALILASTALIVVSFIVALYSKELGNGKIYINIGQNCLPIIMLALSIMVSGAKYGVRAEKVHDCAQILNHLKKQLRFDIDDEAFLPSRENYLNYANKYAEIISKYENHSKIDQKTEELRSWVKFKIPEFFIGFIGRGIFYYFYLLISFMSGFWMFYGVYLAVRGVTFC